MSGLWSKVYGKFSNIWKIQKLLKLLAQKTQENSNISFRTLKNDLALNRSVEFCLKVRCEVPFVEFSLEVLGNQSILVCNSVQNSTN